ncbi:MAG: pyridoxal 5'-phosphate synthase glutaminase subunit PdxT [bacterium]|nr:pyridoxal 5'-phosphate synthase glutaminase subunit PdxT [bacterium]
MAPRVGVLALQGAVEKHMRHLEAAGAIPRPVLLPTDLEGLDAIILPGGESTTMSRLLRTSGLFEPLRDFMRSHPVLATCAGMILLSSQVDNLPYEPYALLDIDVDRNAWGRQIFSFHEDIPWALPSGNGSAAPEMLKAIFIRAPRITRQGVGVEVLATIKDEPVAVRQGHFVALTFHPELSADNRVHRWFLSEIVAPDSC